jgi:hypothetical protein
MCRGQGIAGPQCSALTGERLFRAHDAELVPSGSAPDVDPARPERKQAVNLLIAVRSAGSEVKMSTVLDLLGSVTGMKHMPTSAFSSVPMRSRAQKGPSSRALASRTGPGRAGRERQRRCGEAGRACRQYARHAGRRIRDPALFCRARGRAGSRRQAGLFACSINGASPMGCPAGKPHRCDGRHRLGRWRPPGWNRDPVQVMGQRDLAAEHGRRLAASSRPPPES